MIMKKISLLFLLLGFCAYIFGQDAAIKMEIKRDAAKTIKVYETVNQKAKSFEDAYWYNDFSDPSEWTIGFNPTSDGAVWIITTYETAPANWFPVYGMWEEFASTTVDNGFAVFNSDVQGTDQDMLMQDSWIQFNDPVDFSEMDGAPRLMFDTYYARWEDQVFFEYSLDGGTEWTQVELLLEVISHASNRTTPDYVASVNLPQLAGLDNVMFRFRIIGDWDYGWFIDDVRFIDAPDYEINLADARMNFIDYIDYTVEGQTEYYHLSSHYGTLPVAQYDSPFALSWFNVVAENKGMSNIVPKANVKIYDPEENLIFDESKLGISLAPTQKDTIDLIDVDFALGANPMQGVYNVVYEVTIDGMDEMEYINNTQTATFVISDNTMSRDAGVITAVTGPSMWLSGGNDGDMIGTNYLFLYEDEITSMDVFIAESSTPGTSFMARIMQFDATSEQWVDLTTSTLIEIEEEHLGEWINVTFIDPVFITFEAGDDAKQIKAAIEFYYAGEGSDLRIGYDRSNRHSFWAATWFFTQGDNANSWFSITNWSSEGGLGLRLHTGDNGFPVNFNVIGGNGTLAATVNANPITSGTNVEVGADVLFTATPAANYIVKEWKLNDVVVGGTANTYTLNVTAASTVTVEFQLENSIDQDFLNNLNIYPNPTTGIVNIENVQGANIEIVNLMGQTLVRIDNADQFNNVDISKYSAGTYFIKIVHENVVYTKKLNLIK